MSDTFCPDLSFLIAHGGRVREAAARYGIPLDAWLDLSTGINPNGWPVPGLPASTWSRLPEDDDGLENSARDYYGTEALLAVAGTQAAIQVLPSLRATGRVGVLHPSYAEHAHAWRRAGHVVTTVPADRLSDVVSSVDVLVLIHPNNPTGARFTTGQLLAYHSELVARGGWLVVDEAFMDVTPADSLASYCPRPGLIVLRSLGKFFGLAGARVGFMLGPDSLLRQLRTTLGPWCVAAPSRWIATRALRDREWQQRARTRLCAESERLAILLARHDMTPEGGCALFQWIRAEHAAQLHEQLARGGILTRLFTDPPGLRFGLPGTESAWVRLEAAVKGITGR